MRMVGIVAKGVRAAALLPISQHGSQPAAGPGEPEGVPSGFLAVEPSSAVAPPADRQAGRR